MIELENVTYVVNDARRIAMLSSVFGCERGADYVSCGTSSFVDGDPVLQFIAEYESEGRREEMTRNAFPPAVFEQAQKLKMLSLYSYEVPEYTIYYDEFAANPVTYRGNRNFVLVCTKKPDMFAFAKYIENTGLSLKYCYVVFVDSFTKDDILAADSLMSFPELMLEYVDNLNEKGWHDDVRKCHFKDIVWLQDCLNMTNVQMSLFFDIKLRTIENWRAKPESMPNYAWHYFMQTCFSAKSYLEAKFDADVNAVLSDK